MGKIHTKGRTNVRIVIDQNGVRTLMYQDQKTSKPTIIKADDNLHAFGKSPF